MWAKRVIPTEHTKRKQNKNKGSVTIYLALTLSVMLCLLLILVEGARRNAVTVEADCAVDLAVYSVFGEYNRALYEQYHLLFIDTSYEKKEGSLQEVERHLAAYTRMNLSEGNEAVRTADLTKTFLEDAAVLAASYATDEDAQVFKRQAVCYMKQKYGIAYLEALQREYQTADKLELFTKDIDSQREANQAVIDEAELPPQETGEVDADGNPVMEPVKLENPADAVNGSRPSGVLLLVTDQDALISAKQVGTDTLYSHVGARRQGAGLAGREGISGAQILLFDAYIEKHCGDYTGVREACALDYQLEYIIAGKGSDEANLKAVVHRLLALREVSNLTYLLTDEGKQAEAGALAASVASAAGAPYLTEPIKISLLFAWAYAESVYDVKRLLTGERVKLVKQQQDWHYSLQGMLGYAAEITGGSGEGQDAGVQAAQGSSSAGSIGNIAAIKDGLSYKEYLMLFIMAEQGTKKTARMVDLVEMDVRLTAYNQYFRMDNCVDALSVEVSVGSRYGYGRRQQRNFYYQ